MLLFDPGTTVFPVAPGIFGLAAAESEDLPVILAAEWLSMVPDEVVMPGVPVVVPPVVVPPVVVPWASATPNGTAIKVKAMSKACDLDMISASFRLGREAIQAATEKERGQAVSVLFSRCSITQTLSNTI